MYIYEEENIMQRKYFDCFGKIGRPAVPSKEFAYDVKAMLADMEYARIHGAMVIHNAAVDYSFSEGNIEAVKIAKDNNRLFALGVVSSTSDYETGDKNYFNDLLDRGVKGFALLAQAPKLCGTMEPKSLKKIAKPLIERNKPLVVIDVNSEELYSKIDKVAFEYPDLNIIMQGTRWNTNRFLFEVMEKHDNLYFELSQNHTNNLLEFTKENFGIDKVLYSGEWPLRSMGALKATVEYADISEYEKNLVAAGNACTLFGISKEELELYNEEACKLDEIAKEADEGKPISVPVIDMHSHIVGEKVGINNCIMLDATPKAIVDKMDRLGIDTTITAPWSGIIYSGTEGNRESIKAYREYKDRFLAYSCCNINYNEEVEKAIRCHRDYPDLFVGVKPYPPAFKFKLTDKRCEEWFKYADEHNLCMLVHAESAKWVEEIDEVSEKYPNIVFILAHSGSNYDNARRNIALAKKHANIVLDITYTTTGQGMIEYLVKEIGADRILYGSDMPMRDAAPQLGWVCYAHICVEDKKKILAENILSILERRI